MIRGTCWRKGHKWVTGGIYGDRHSWCARWFCDVVAERPRARP